MGQDEILAFFKERAERGLNPWLTFAESRREMRKAGAGMGISICSFNRQLRALVKSHHLEQQELRGMSWRVTFRYPEKEGVEKW